MKLTTILAFFAFVASSLFSTVSRAENATAALPAAIEGGACSDEATLSDMQAAKPFICMDGKWRKVVFKTDGEGVTAPLYYEGKCSWRFTEGGNSKTRLTLKGQNLADLCLPVGWRVHLAASGDSMSWKYHSPTSMPNVILVQAIDAGHRTTLWVYPVTSEGKAPQKLEVQLRSVK